MISTLDFVYVVLGVGLIPFFTLLCMILWRVYKMMDHVDNVMTFVERVINYLNHLDKVPGMVASKIMSSMDNFFK
jgi:hypothetical protein